jgi:hypothetical protein
MGNRWESAEVYEWRLDTGDVTSIGRWPWEQHLRGLPGGRFIAVQPDGYTILSFD